MRRALLIAAFAALSLPAQAFAHATLERTSPSFEQRLSNSPRTVTLRFDQYIERLPYAIQLYSTHGELRVPRIRAQGRDLIASVPKLRRGAYTIRWHALSGDGHVVSGVFTFGVRAKAPAPTEAFGASGPTRTENVVRWLYFLSLALVVGGLGFRLLVARRRLPDRFFALTGIGVFATLNVGIAAFVLRAEDALQLPFGRLLYGDLSPIAHTRFGAAFNAGASWKSELADWAHLSAACLWIGGLVQLVVVVWPLLPDLRRPALVAFSRLATVCVGVLLLAGVYLAILRLPQVSDLWTTGYGRILLVKVGLVALAFAWGGVHKLRAVPVVARDGTVRRLRASLAGESMVGMIVLLVAAFLVNAKPPT